MHRIDLSLKHNFKIPLKRESIVHKLYYEVIAIVVTVVEVVVSFIGSASVLTSVLISAVVMGANQMAQFFQSRKDIDAMRQARRAAHGIASDISRNGQLINTRHSSDPVRVIYGIVKTGGVWAYNKTSREDNEILNTVITWGEGEIAGIGTGIDQFPIFSGTVTLNDLHTGGEFVLA